MTKRRILTSRRILLLAPLLLAPACDTVEAQAQGPPAGAATELPAGERAIEVEVRTIERGSGYGLVRHYTGELRAARRQTLGFEVAGLVQAVLIRAGERVEAGEPLAVLDGLRLQVARAELAARLDGARASLDEAVAGPRREVVDAAKARVVALESDLSLAQKRLVRRKELLATNAASTEDVDAAAATVDTLAATLAGSRAQLAELEAGTRTEQLAAARANVEGLEASLRRIDIDLEDLTLRAPFAGTISARHIDEGAIVSVGTAAVDLVETGALEAWIGVPPEELAGLESEGPTVLVRGTERTWDGLRSLPELDLMSRTVTVVLQLGDGDSAALRPGELARLQVRRQVAEPGFWVPTLALSQGARGLWSLFLLPQDAGTGPAPVQRADVEVLHVEGERSYVRGTLKDGDRIVLTGPHRIAPGQLVTPRGGEPR